ncbi:MAG: sulfur carrier protein ThiS [Eubacterium aggregans]|uniref:Sulfur carrier protein ThiS n=1 Tax=Eubacterium aggregans TaxID=81409 RepID=A0A1H4DCY2_9FIRM|nr:sulfur carrier protein ThiS [Eubacterium aggregans]MDD4690814.1 sulfur carrier protein ThiS [Eubacterium aggregans]MEA5074009.1 sulfur carrier protein ThiS [Eubacterium aggregans]SEA70249.1 sulfur carrier protein ThiS [Eubacterium aggregans]
MINVNGVPQEGCEGLSLSAVLTKLGYAESRIAVELNGQIIPRRKHLEQGVSDGDHLEVVTFVGGG